TYTSDGDPKDFASTSVKTGKLIASEFTGVEQVVITTNGFGMDASYEDHVIPIAGKYVSPEFAEVFDFEVLHGNLYDALDKPYSLALTATANEKLFGGENGLNKLVKDGEGTSYVIRAILADMPYQSHIKVEALCSFSTKEDEHKEETWFQEWTNMWSNHVYVKLEEGYPVDQFRDQLADLSRRQNEVIKSKIEVKAIPLTDIIPGPDMSNMGGPSFDLDIIYLLAGLALIILISACFNYTNLSVARALRRSKEVAVRKTVGASRGQIFFQFALEATIVSVIALCISVGFFFLLKPFFHEALGYQGEMLKLPLSFSVCLIFLVFAIITGILAGLFPSFIMSGMKVKSIIYDATSIKLFSNISIRKALIVFQFSLSMIFIISTLIGFRQYNFMLNFDLGYDTENVLNLYTANNKYETIENELRKVPQVKDVSFSLLVPSVGSMYYENISDPLSRDSLELAYNRVSDNYLRLHGHELLAGNHFDESFLNAESKRKMIVNEKFLDKFGILSPEEAIGREFDIYKDKGVVVGVVKDFYYGTTQNELGPFLFLNGEGDGSEQWPSYYQANIKLHKGNLKEAMTAVEEAWKRVDDVHQFNAIFYSEEIERTYAFFKSLISIVGVLAVIAISIASLGLLGMVVFTTETRLKEISIRKILGATEANLLYLLGRSFVILLLIAACIAIPSTLFVFDNYILQDYLHRPDISMVELIGGSMIILCIGAVVITFQTIWAARSNPANMLRSE
ncbi:MAG: FtsX-like permease family protein, partial [Cyclobacteriaceae bacterium]